ncbi:hypothetical protein SRABI27_03765 [Pedobacter sp. Bi27]|uniref:hypothetical protein n=1 Tax=Pedobacter sp. Bi27 TaxID=2822351 RepID=UPI001D592660|nr:hypothetical protein [Pedobacter sp. Bi27]CAH0280672.1 hypothetical protein SRABI27_03765 [Pedobacter sp. Bi27]
MIDASKILKAYGSDLLGSLLHLQQNPQIFDSIISMDIACDQLAPLAEGVHASAESDRICRVLHNNGLNEAPAVYWFEIISDHTADQIRNSYIQHRETIGERKMPAIYKNYQQDSKILYVGKGNTNISGRMFLHLGYEPKQIHLQGLQLCHWDYLSELKGLVLRLNIVYLPLNMTALTSVFEYHLAKTLKPILGKHR